MSANSTKSTQQFNEQYYLLIQSIKGALPKTPADLSSSKFSQKSSTNVPLNIITDGSYDPSAIINFALNAKEKDKMLFSDMTTDQLSSLVPNVRLYKAIGDIYKPFYFPGSTTISEVEDITRSGGRLKGAGIQSFSVDFHGSDTFTADKLLTCNLSVFVQNMNSLFDEPPGSGTYAKLAELITISTKKDKKENSNLVKSGDSRVDSSQTAAKMANFEIVADIGWAVYPEMKEIFSRSQIRAVEANRMSIRMTLKNHDLNFEQNGTLVINAQYIGRLETVLEQRTSDLLLDINMFKDVNEQMKSTRGPKKDISVEDTSDPSKRNEVCVKPQQLLSSQLDDILSRLDPSPGASKIHSIELTKEDEELFFKESVTGPSGQSDKSPSPRMTSGAAESSSNVGSFSNKSEPSTEKSKKTKKDKTSCGDQPEKEEQSPPKEKTKQPPKRTPANEGSKPEPIKMNLSGRNIHFFYLADLFEVLLQKIKENHQSVDDEQLKKQLETFRIILGTIKLTAGDVTRTVSIGDIPITVREYSHWFMDKVVRRRRTRYSFQKFMKDVMSHLVFKAIKGFSFRDAPVLDNSIKFGSTIMTSQDKGENLKNKTVISVKDLPRFSSKTTKGGIYEEVDYILFYTREEEKPSRPKRTGNPEVDIKNGVPHVYLGLNRGLVKNISFQQVSIPFRKEALIANAVDLFDELRMPYNATISMFGNTLFLPGTQFYINPLTIGMGDPRNANSAAVKLGLGGYYMTTRVAISFNGTTLSTELSAIYEGWPENKPNDKSPSSGEVDPIRDSINSLGGTIADSVGLELSPDADSSRAEQLSEEIYEQMNEPDEISTTPLQQPLNARSDSRQAELAAAQMIATRIDHEMRKDLALPSVDEAQTRNRISEYANSVLSSPRDQYFGDFSFSARNYDTDSEDLVMFKLASGSTYIFTFSGDSNSRVMTPRSEIPWNQEERVIIGGSRDD